MHPLVYALLCVAVPLLWGFLVARVFDRLDRRQLPSASAEPAAEQPGEIEYYI